MLETSARILRLLALLQSRRSWTGAELAARLEVTTRTIRNDVDRLRRLGYPVDSTSGTAGGYELRAGAHVPPLLLDDDEAVAIAASLLNAGAAADGNFEDHAARALAKLLPLLPKRLEARVGALSAATLSVPATRTRPSVDHDVLGVVAIACRDHTELHLDYVAHDGSSTHRRIEPHRLVTYRGRWLLLAWDRDRDDWRTFRVDRVAIPVNHAGREFVPRALSNDDAISRIVRGVDTASWTFRAVVEVAASTETVASRLPSAVAVEPLEDDRCRIHVGSDSPELLAAHLALIGYDIRIEHATDHEALEVALRTLSARLDRAAG